MPTMLRTIVGDLLRQEPDMVVVARTQGGSGALGRAREQNADILITQDGADEPGGCLETILRSEALGICSLSADGRSASAVNLVRRPVGYDDDRFALADAVRRIAESLQMDSAAASPAGRDPGATGDRP